MASKFKLPATDVAELQQAQRALNDILPEFETAETCGIECQEYRRMRDEAAKTIENLLVNYGPGVKG